MSKTKGFKPTVVELNLSGDIPASLRRAAERIEAGEHPDLRFVVAVFVDRNAAFATFGWGQMSTLEAIGALTRAATRDLVDDERDAAG